MKNFFRGIVYLKMRTNDHLQLIQRSLIKEKSVKGQNYFIFTYYNKFIIYKFILMFQKSCIDFSIHATPLERYMPEERAGFKYQLWRIVESTAFEYFIMTLIVLNTILLMMKVRPISPNHPF